MVTVITHRFAACAVLTLLASLPPFANATQYGNDPLGQAYTHDGGGYIYDANQNQTFQYVKAPGSTTPTVAYAAFPGLEIEYRLDASGNLTRQALRRHIGSERKTVIGPSDDAMVEFDVLGNVAMVRHGTNTAYANYTPFGQMIQSRTTGFSNEWYGYKGGRIDETGTGLYRFGARSYDPNSTRWTSRDPIRNQLAASDAYAAFDENPIVNDDPSGLQSMPGNAIEHPTPIPPADGAAALRLICQASPSECINGEPNSHARAAYYAIHGQLPAITPLAGQNGTLQPGSGRFMPASASSPESLGARPEIQLTAGAIVVSEGVGAGIVRFGSRLLPRLNAARAAAFRRTAALFFSVGSTAAGTGPVGAAPNWNTANPTNLPGPRLSTGHRAGSSGGGGGGGNWPDGAFIEIGYGANPRAPQIARATPGAAVFGIDMDDYVVRYVQGPRMARNVPENCLLGPGRASELPSNFFMRAYSFFPHRDDAAGVLRNGNRALQPNGSFFGVYDPAVSVESIVTAAVQAGSRFRILDENGARALMPEIGDPRFTVFGFGIWVLKPPQYRP